MSLKYQGIREALKFVSKKKIVILVMFSIIIGGLSIIPVQIIGLSIDIISGNNDFSGISQYIYTEISSNPAVLLLIFGFISIIVILLNVLFGYKVSMLTYETQIAIKKELFAKTIREFNPLKTELKEGDILQRLTNEVNSINQVLSVPLNGLLRSFMELAWILVIFSLWNIRLAIITLSFYVPMYYIAKSMAMKMHDKYTYINQLNASLKHYILNSLQNQKIIHLFKTYSYETKRADDYLDKILSENRTANRALLRYFPVIDLFKISGVVTALIFSSFLIVSGNISPGNIMVIYIYTENLWSSC